MIAIDTNILLYVHDPRDSAKQAIAASLLQSLPEGQQSHQLVSVPRERRPSFLNASTGGISARASLTRGDTGMRRPWEQR